MYIDLHVHTTASDGQYTPKEIISIAKNNQIDVIAITDHDTIMGVRQAQIEGLKCGIEVIPGVEVSAEYKSEMHLLGYFIDLENKELIDYFNAFCDGRKVRNLKYVEYFNSIGIDMTYDEVVSCAGDGSVGKPHFIEVLKRRGIITNSEEGYKNYFAKEPLASINRFKLSPKEIIEKINKAGGLVVLAHPRLLGIDDDELDMLVSELKGYGLAGIEVYHSENPDDKRKYYLELARKYNLIVTGGSDFHGEKIKADIELGMGINKNVCITDKTIIDNMKKCILTKKNAERME